MLLKTSQKNQTIYIFIYKYTYMGEDSSNIMLFTKIMFAYTIINAKKFNSYNHNSPSNHQKPYNYQNYFVFI